MQVGAGANNYLPSRQDPESSAANAPPTFLLRLGNEDVLNFEFTFIVRQARTTQPTNGASNDATTSMTSLIDTHIKGLTYVSASNFRELENLVTREFHADPNLHKNPNVELVGDFSSGGKPIAQFEWSWRWKPPKATEDRGGGWRNSCSVWPGTIPMIERVCIDLFLVCRVRSACTSTEHLGHVLVLGSE